MHQQQIDIYIEKYKREIVLIALTVVTVICHHQRFLFLCLRKSDKTSENNFENNKLTICEQKRAKSRTKCNRS